MPTICFFSCTLCWEVHREFWKPHPYMIWFVPWIFGSRFSQNVCPIVPGRECFLDPVAYGRPRWVGKASFSDSHTQALQTWGSALSRNSRYGNGARRKDAAVTPFHGLCQHAMQGWIRNIVQREMFTESFPVGDWQECSFHPLHPIQEFSDNTSSLLWGWWTPNSLFIFQLLKLYVKTGSLDYLSRDQLLKTSQEKFSSRKRKNFIFKITVYFKYLNIWELQGNIFRKSRDTKIKYRLREYTLGH